MTKEDKAEVLSAIAAMAHNTPCADGSMQKFASALAGKASRLSAPDEGVQCDYCNGKGWCGGMGADFTCPECNGTGKIPQSPPPVAESGEGAPPAPVTTEGPHDDLVKRLRENCDAYDIYGVHGPLRLEAATLIERLSAPPQESVKRWLELNPHDCDSPAIYMAEMKERGDAMAASIGRLEEKLVLFDAIRKESIERREKLEAAEARLKAAEEVVEAVGPALSCALLGLQVAADSVPLTHAHIENNIYLMCQTINRHLARLSIDVLTDGRRVDIRLPLTERLLALTARKEV